MTVDRDGVRKAVLNMCRYAAITGHMVMLGERNSPKFRYDEVVKIKPTSRKVHVYNGEVDPNSISKYLDDGEEYDVERVKITNIYTLVMKMIDESEDVEFDTFSIEYTHLEDRRKRLLFLCRSALESDVGKNTVSIINEVNDSKYDYEVFVVYDKKPKSNNFVYVNRPNVNMKIDIVSIDTFYTIPTYHSRGPRFEILSKDDVPPGKLPLTYIDDPHTMYTGAKVGDVILYTHSVGHTNSEYVAISKVINRHGIIDEFKKYDEDENKDE